MILFRLHLRRRPPRIAPIRSFSSTPHTLARTAVRTAKESKRRQKLSVEDLSSGPGRPPLPQLPVDRSRGTRIHKTWPEVPQGPLAAPVSSPTAAVLEERRYPTVVQQALENMQRLGPEIVLLTRVGGFYELYFDAAEQWAGRLGLKVGEKKTVAGPVAMAGFPWWRLEQFLKVLVKEEGQYVAICEEYAKPTTPEGEFITGELMFDRRIQRIVTPGTLIDEEWIEAGENHFLLALENGDAGELGIAWTDLGTGEVWCSTCGRDGLAAELGRISPREVVVKSGETALEGMRGGLGTWVLTTHDLSTATERKATVERWEGVTAEGEEVNREELEKLSRLERAAAERLLDYVESRLPGIDVKLQAPVRRKASEVMGIDVNSMRGLEIKATLRDGFAKGSLLHTVDRTVTRGGKRLLGNWLCMFLSFCPPPTLAEDVPTDIASP